MILANSFGPFSWHGPSASMMPQASAASNAPPAKMQSTQATGSLQAKTGTTATASVPRSRTVSMPRTNEPPQALSAPTTRSNSSPAASAHVGVGMEFDAQRMVVIGLRPGCAAAHSQQIQVGDQLISVEGQQPTDFKQARDLILGTQGTSVSLTFKKQSSNTRYAVTLLRGTAEYFLMAERCKQLETRIAQIEKEKPQSQDVPLRPTPEDVKAHVSAQVSIAALQKKVEELESENNELRHTVMSNRRNGAENGASVQKLQVELQEAADEKQMLGKQVTQLQRLIGEKDSQIKDVKAKSRDLQGSLARRLKDLEDVLKDRVEAKNERIVDLNKQLMDARAETEGLRAENQALRNVVNQTNQKLNALISLQMDAADREGGHVNQELIMLRSKTASLEAEIQRIKSPMDGQVEVDGLQMQDDESESTASDSQITGNGVELSTKPLQRTLVNVQQNEKPASPLVPALNLQNLRNSENMPKSADSSIGGSLASRSPTLVSRSPQLHTVTGSPPSINTGTERLQGMRSAATKTPPSSLVNVRQARSQIQLQQPQMQQTFGAYGMTSGYGVYGAYGNIRW